MSFPELSTDPCSGRIHSIETCGTVDGPGVRFVVFTQGCPMRCLYCHNPDTWAFADGTWMSVPEILAQYEKNQAYYTRGGLTVTGGEPMLQMEFLTTLMETAKARGIHTCLDTSGVCYQADNPRFMAWMKRLARALDLVLLDIKHMDDAAHLALTGHSNRNILSFARYLEEQHVPVWLRHVLVEGYTLDADELHAFGKFAASLSNVEKTEVLPYHSMGKEKYEKLKYAYPLARAKDVTATQVAWAEAEIRKGMEDCENSGQKWGNLPVSQD